MLFSLLILILNSFLLHADPPRAPSEAERFERECAPRMAQGVDHYAACVADKTHEAEAAEHRRLVEARHMKEIIGGYAEPDVDPIPEKVCNEAVALRSCTEASNAAARANNPSSTDQQISQALRSCQSACNPHLIGCSNVTSLKQKMLQTMNNCGAGSGSVAQNEDDSTWTGWATSKFNAITTQAGNWWDRQVDQQEANAQAKRQAEVARMISINEAPFVGGGGSAAVSFKAASVGSGDDPIGEGAGLFVGIEAPPINAEFSTSPQLRFGDEVTSTPGAEAPYSMGTTGGTVAEPAPGQNPPPPGGGSRGDNTGGNSNGSIPDTSVAGNGGDRQVVSPINEPVNYQAGNFAGLQSAMSSPAVSGGIASSSSSGGEVSRGGSSSGGSYSGSSTNPDSRPLAFEGSGQVSPSALRGADAPAGSIAGGARPAMDVAAPSGGFRGGGHADFGGGRILASSRPTGPASLESSMTTAMRSDSFYRTSGGRGTGAAARSIARRTAPCKGPNCPRKTRAGIAAANCEGNPQCLLALTGKLQGPRRQAVEEVWETDSSGVRRVRANAGERGIASVPHKTMPGGVVRGKIQDVLNHLGSSEVFKVDHDGMLEVDL